MQKEEVNRRENSSPGMGTDLTSGSILLNVIKYSVPLILTGFLQICFNTADVIIAGRFAGETALAAVGSTSNLINLIVNLFMMTSVGSSVIVARHYGAQEYDSVQVSVATSFVLSVIMGVFVGLLGYFAAEPMLILMECPENVIGQATLYLEIYFMGIPAFMVYSFCAAVLRGVGDTKKPLMYLTIAGIINVILNIITVVYMNMGVAGVAVATAVSQYISAILVLRTLIGAKGCMHLSLRLKNLHMHRQTTLEIMKIGIPAGLQSVLYNIGNVMIQASINSFGHVMMAGSAASQNFEGIICNGPNAVQQASLAFTGQCIGAKKYDRIKDVCRSCMIVQLATCGAICAFSYIFSEELISVYNSDAGVIYWGSIRLRLLSATYCLMAAYYVLEGMMRGMGYSMLPTGISILGICGLRVVWVLAVFSRFKDYFVLFLCYPVSWLIVLIGYAVSYRYVYKKVVCQGLQTL